MEKVAPLKERPEDFAGTKSSRLSFRYVHVLLSGQAKPGERIVLPIPTSGVLTRNSTNCSAKSGGNPFPVIRKGGVADTDFK